MKINICNVYEAYCHSRPGEFLCIETGECFSEFGEIYNTFKDEYTWLKLPKRDYNEHKRKFIKLSQIPELISLLDISDPVNFSHHFHLWSIELNIDDLFGHYSWLQSNRELAKWCEENNLEWIYCDPFGLNEWSIEDDVDFTDEIKKRTKGFSE